MAEEKKEQEQLRVNAGTVIGSQYRNKPTFTGVNWVEFLIESGTLTHEDIPTFSFAPLDQIRKDLTEAGYTEEEIESTIVGLSELPEYAKSYRNQKSKK